MYVFVGGGDGVGGGEVVSFIVKCGMYFVDGFVCVCVDVMVVNV